MATETRALALAKALALAPAKVIASAPPPPPLKDSGKAGPTPPVSAKKPSPRCTSCAPSQPQSQWQPWCAQPSSPSRSPAMASGAAANIAAAASAGMRAFLRSIADAPLWIKAFSLVNANLEHRSQAAIVCARDANRRRLEVDRDPLALPVAVARGLRPGRAAPLGRQRLGGDGAARLRLGERTPGRVAERRLLAAAVDLGLSHGANLPRRLAPSQLASPVDA